MVQIQFEINEHVNKQLKIYMAYNDISSKTEAVKTIIDEYFLIRPPKIKFEDEKHGR